VISTATVDREKDIVDPDGMVAALQKWTAVGKKIPLAWNHSSAAEDQIGHIDPASAKNVNGEVVVDGWIDRSIEVGRHAWRLVKAGTLGFSFGYLVPDGGATKRRGGGRHLKEFDVFEVTASPTPMNNDTRVLGWKATAERRVPTNEELVAECKRLGLEIPLTQAELRRKSDELTLDVALGQPLKEFRAQAAKRAAEEPEKEPLPSEAELRRKSDDLMIEVALGRPLAELRERVDAEPETPSTPTDAELRAKCKALGFAVPAPHKGTRIDLDAVRAEAKALMMAQLRGAQDDT
jgi:hypothetical protein